MRQRGIIEREDMLELTRRMTLSRNCFSRIAGAYFDEEGNVDGTFNRFFKQLKANEQHKNLEIAKAIPFAETNVKLQEYVFHGRYDVPLKGNDQMRQWESEEVYSFLIGALCRVDQEYEPQNPERRFLFPAFKNRSTDCGRIEIFRDYTALVEDAMKGRI